MPEICPSATIIPMKESDRGFTILVLRRNRGMMWGNEWVFPGGKIEPYDYTGENDVYSAAMQAAVRETKEEAGICFAVDELVHMARWTTPESLPKRYITWFFLSDAGSDCVRIDGSEIVECQWISPKKFFETDSYGQITMPPPTFVTISLLSSFQNMEDALSHFRQNEPMIFVPRIIPSEKEKCFLYHGDSAYESGDIHEEGKRHRLTVRGKRWHYQKDGFETFRDFC
ncbi:MAG: NUDIX domain-containing protein [Desulfococcaceae bacterium]